eukprot:6537951-Pyramimonas_sp.AAC.1
MGPVWDSGSLSGSCNILSQGLGPSLWVRVWWFGSGHEAKGIWLQVWACTDERVSLAELAAPTRSAFSAIAWGEGGDGGRLVATIGAEVWVVQWDAACSPTSAVVQKRLFAEGGAFRALQCVGELV